MKLWELFLVAIALSMDAFAVSICKGLSMKKADVKNAVLVGAYFGIFQGLMPLIGYFLGSQFSDKIVAFDHWIAFVLLGLIGSKMIKESLESHQEGESCNLSFAAMLPLAIATSIDALVVGLTFSLLEVDILPAVIFIGVITFSLSAFGVKVGSVFGCRFKAKAEFAGGFILILIGLKILLEHLMHP
ncbi:MAG: manganese efflux pump MntP family protein [Clostridiales bacterium]